MAEAHSDMFLHLFSLNATLPCLPFLLQKVLSLRMPCKHYQSCPFLGDIVHSRRKLLLCILQHIDAVRCPARNSHSSNYTGHKCTTTIEMGTCMNDTNTIVSPAGVGIVY